MKFYRVLENGKSLDKSVEKYLLPYWEVSGFEDNYLYFGREELTDFSPYSITKELIQENPEYGYQFDEI